MELRKVCQRPSRYREALLIYPQPIVHRRTLPSARLPHIVFSTDFATLAISSRSALTVLRVGASA